MTRRFHLRTFGCQMNEHDSERLAGLMAADGMEPTDDLESADVVVLNTCCIRENADNRLYGHLGHLKSLRDRRPGLRIVVGGCLAQKDGGLIQQRAPHVDVVLGTHNVERAVELLHRAEDEGPLTEILDAPDPAAISFPSSLPALREAEHSAWVTIQVGCDNQCTFCIVPSVRGREASRPFSEVVGEVEQLAERGVTEVTLLGQNVNSYGRDLVTRFRRRGSRAHQSPEGEAALGSVAAGAAELPRRPLFSHLLRAVGSVGGVRRVRFTSPHPKDLRPETVAAMAETPAVCEHLHLPLQSGSDRVLARMRRGYTARRYLERLASARAEVDDLAVTTDVIVGFPGETEKDFQKTLEVVSEARYDGAFTFVYSPRPGTPAADMRGLEVPDDEVADRFARLKVVVERSALERHRARIGRVEEALVEGPSKRDPSMLTGRTRQAKLVHFPAGGQEPGSYVDVAITGAAPHHLTGEVAEPAGRRRLVALRARAGSSPPAPGSLAE